jgi:hypothetical protein
MCIRVGLAASDKEAPRQGDSERKRSLSAGGIYAHESSDFQWVARSGPVAYRADLIREARHLIWVLFYALVM